MKSSPNTVPTVQTIVVHLQATLEPTKLPQIMSYLH